MNIELLNKVNEQIRQCREKYGNYASVAREIGRSSSTVAYYIKLTSTPDIVAQVFKESLK